MPARGAVFWCLSMLSCTGGATAVDGGTAEADSTRSFGRLAHDGVAAYWLDPATHAVVRQTAKGSPAIVVADAGQNQVSGPLIASGLLVWADTRIQVFPLDGGGGWHLATGQTSTFAASGSQLALLNEARTQVSVWDLETKARRSIAPLVGGSALGYAADDSVLVGDCLYRSDDEGLALAVLKLSSDGERLQPWARASCPVAFLRDGPATYVSDYTPPSGQLPGTSVLRRLERDGGSVRLPFDGALFVRAGRAFRYAESVTDQVRLADGGAALDADGGLLFRQRPTAVEAVSLQDGGTVRVVGVNDFVLGFAVDGTWSYVLSDAEPPALSVAALPQALQLP